MNKTWLIPLLGSVLLWTAPGYAADTSCEAQATAKKLAGAARTSFVKKCERVEAAVSPACEKSAADKKLAGAAKASHIKKCMADEAAAAAKK